MLKQAGKPKITIPPSLKGGGTKPKVKGYIGDSSAKKNPMPSAKSVGKGTVKLAPAPSPKVSAAQTAKATRALSSPKSTAARNARLAKASL